MDENQKLFNEVYSALSLYRGYYASATPYQEKKAEILGLAAHRAKNMKNPRFAMALLEAMKEL